MVYTRSQKAKEEHDTNLAKYQSLLENSQAVSVLRKLQQEFEAAVGSQPGTSQLDIADQGIAEHDLIKQTLFNQNAFNLNILEQNTTAQAIVEHGVVRPTVTEQNVVQQGYFGDVSVQLDAKQPVSNSDVLKYQVEETLILVTPAREFAKAQVQRLSSAKPEFANPKGLTDISTQVRKEKSSTTKTDRKKEPAHLASTSSSDVNGHGVPASALKHTKKYFLRSQDENEGEIAPTKDEEFPITLATSEHLNIFADDNRVEHTTEETDNDSARMSHRHDEKVGDGSHNYQIMSAMERNEQETTSRGGTAPSKITSKQKPTTSRVALKAPRRLTFRQGEVVVDNGDANTHNNEDSVMVKDCKLSGTGSKKYVVPVKKTKRTKKQGVRRTIIDGKSFKIPINPEDEQDFTPENDAVVDMQKKYTLRKRTNRSTDREIPVRARFRSKKSPKPPSIQTTRTVIVAGGHQKGGAKIKLIVKLPSKRKLLTTAIKPTKKTKKTVLKRVRTPKDFFSNKYRFKLRWTPFEEYPQVNKQTYQEVYQLLSESLVPFGISLDRKNTNAEIIGAPQGPMHAGDAVTVDALVKVIMSQATSNKNALSAQAGLIQAFPYTINEKAVVGKIPNYHDIRTAEVAKLMKALKAAGLHKKRAKIIPDCLNVVRQKNIDANSPNCTIDSNPANIADFVPGSLSLDYLNKLNAQEMFDELVSLPGIGVKTACCILAFNFQLPVFAVDTHVFRMVKWLGWVPQGCNRNDAAAHLDKFVPDDLKYGLHQGFWHHGQKCLRCIAKNDPKTKGWEDAVCVIEQFLKRHPKIERKTSSPKRKRVDDDNAESGMSDSLKPKKRKESNTIVFAEMTVAQATERGYELRKYQVDDNFGAQGTNIIRAVREWVKTTV